MQEPQVILVNEQDTPLGLMNKMQAHTEGKLHRAFSVFIFNHNNEMLLQQRAHSKYHSAGLWTNACCSHPLPNEETIQAAHRRLKEEMNLECTLEKKFSFTYHAVLENGLIEHELDHVYFGYTSELPQINEQEVQAYKYISIEDLAHELQNNKDIYTAWFKICFSNIKQHLNLQNIL